MATQESLGSAETKSRTARFPPQRDFSSISIRDLLDAREAYHVHLSNISSVLGTAIGRYRIHRDDWYAENPPGKPREQGFPKVDEPRTLENSVVRPWSWPCVIVFVKTKQAPSRYELVPQRLYLPDGRVVPTCVVYAPPDEDLPAPTGQINYASEMTGGGYACTRLAQSITRQGTIGCLVERGGSYYALTNSHVAGPDGGFVKTMIRGQSVTIGTADARRADRVAMQEIFPEWPGERTLINLDAGLVRLDDVRNWTSQVFGIGEIGDPFDATASSLTLDLIGCPVRAYGGASGVLEGEIQAMFVRYKTLNGFQYVTDLLIGRRKEGPAARSNVDTQPGDSGTLWFYDPPSKPEEVPHDPELMAPEPRPERGRRARRLRPIAMQWGGQRLRGLDDAPVSHALATFVSTVCRVLDVEIVRGYGTGHDEYWGKTGHFSVGWKACDRIDGGKLPRLAALMSANQPRIGFADDRLIEGAGFRNGRNGFVPLSDVPDYVFGFGGNYGAMQHFADIDIKDVDGGAPMLDLCVADPKNVSAKAWHAYFEGFKNNDVGPDEGTLPFRVWQLWQMMVDAIGAGDVIGYVTAGGIMAHYVGDASQPLHGSVLHHGRGPTKKTIKGTDYPYRHGEAQYDAFHDSAEGKIHAIYEQQMLEIETELALAGVNANLAAQNKPASNDITNGWEAACAVIDLMERCRTQLSPDDIIDADDPSLKPKQRATRLWNTQTVRDSTIGFLAESTQLLARLWMSAWVVAGGEHKVTVDQARAFSEDELIAVYKAQGYARAYSLKQMSDSGKFEPP